MKNIAYVAAAGLIILAAILGYAIGKQQQWQQVGTKTQLNPTQEVTESKPDTSIFTTQTATIQGKITKLAGSTISIVNDKGQAGDFPISTKLTVYKFQPGSSLAQSSTDIKSIETERKVSVNLEFIDNQYQVISITYAQ